jgi:ADP-ribose pyrophosphatase YjhB (NUDIX family)
VVVRGDDVVVIQPARRGNHREVWALPKGHPDGEETPLEAATREVREETGVEGNLIAELGEVEYTFERGGREVDKRVVFFLFEYREGELTHDHEIAAVRWMPLEEAARVLTHAGEREMVQRALSRARADR